ncbi:carboxylesterase/lipase family protein [Streptomyces sp. QL37]|uniref:carboxylesterase/lipase family protein n=1 Tax=Streptomyces sp. QL37 TaxID=2093747 RepID=UPI000CF2340C|nr:carboxylesterase family protein [Streptomyces sp. QL37]PPQ55690.1 carboxylesterase [Streptomyces sp. QL37]
MEEFTTKAGVVAGRRAARDPGVVVLRGIPYAAPPFGAGRFRAPRPAAPWDGVRDCAGFGPVAPQSAELPGSPVWSPGDEDILSLNIWTSGGGGDTLPVLVWIHGGAYAFGSSAQPDFDGTALAGRGLVVVTLNYRLGFEGFGHVPSADGEEPCPDNRGLLDQIAALRWVRDNIAAFGGDPGRVTVAGQSSGATSVACLMVMDGARGLFGRAIAHSAVNACASPESAARTTAEVAAAAGVAATYGELVSVSPEALVDASDRVTDGYRRDPGSGARHYDPAIYGPVAGGSTLALDPLTAFARGAGREIELLVCHTVEEYWLLDAVGSCAKVTEKEQLEAFATDFQIPEAVVDGYRGLAPEASVHDTYLAVYGDLLFGEYSSRLAEAHTRGGGRSRLSRFVRRSDGRGQPVRAWHCADIPFAFGTVDDEDVHFLIGGPPGAADRELASRMTRAWAEFAATGDPGWPPLTAGGGPVRIWDTSPEAAPEDRWDSFRAPWRAAGLPLLTP